MRAFAVLTFGAVVIGLSANWRDRVIAPGPLARQHAQLLERSDAAANCAACHAAAEQSAAGWLASLVIGRGDRPSQSQLCMKCHAKTIPVELALNAHNAKKGSGLFSADNDVGTHQASQNSSDPFSSIACSACHREHHGTQVDLTAIDNVACQSCHRQRYESFASDHPDFGIWPYERRTRIAFNHASHRDKHFAEKQKSFDCSSCHVEDASGKVQLTASYEATCAACHDEKITLSVARGAQMLALPTMDITALRAAGLEIGGWPSAATGDFDGRLPPVMKLLLAADPVAAQAMAKLGPDFDFQEVNAKDRQQLEACAALATAIRKLAAELVTSVDGTVRNRLPQVLGRTIADTQINSLVGGLSSDTLRAAVHSWFGEANTAVAVSNVTSRASANQARSILTERRPIVFAPVGTWFHDDASLSIRYRPSAHADPVLTTWLNVLTETTNLNERPVAAAIFKEFSKVNAPGLCASCHSIERNAPDSPTINWRADDGRDAPRGFTKFAHGPHLVLPQLADCTHCHSIDGGASAAVGYTDWDPTRFVGDFAPISKRQCTECHTPKAAGDACQQCHNYHVQTASLLRIKRSASGNPKAAIQNPLELPAVFSAGTGDIVGTLEPTVHEVETQ